MQSRTTLTLCRICLRSCGIKVTQSGGDIRIKGNPEHPVSQGFICFRGAHYPQIWNSPRRITEPLLKKEGKWVPISYQEAIQILADKIKQGREQNGAQSIAVLKGESLKHQEIGDYLRHLTYALGSPNYLTIGSMCQKALVMGHEITYGGVPGVDFETFKTGILWGRNPAVASAQFFKQMKSAVKKGFKLVVIDPSQTKTAEIADIHLRLTPGSDGYLALAFIKVATETYTLSPDPELEIGWNDLKKHLQELTLDSLLEKTGIDKQLFWKAAHLIFDNRPCFNQAGLGLELQPNGIQTIRAIACFHSLLAPKNFPRRMSFPFNPLPEKENYPPLADPIGKKEAPYFVQRGTEGQAMLLPQAVLEEKPYAIKTLLVFGSNPALTFPDEEQQKQTFKKLDFLAVSDLFMTATAQQADLFLPAADFLDNLEIHDYGRVGKPYLGLVRPIAKSGPGWPVWKWVFKLAHQLELERYFPWQTNEDALAYKLKGTGITLDELKESPTGLVPYPESYLKKTENAPLRKVCFFSEALEKMVGYGAITADSFKLPYTTDRAFPFWLSTGDRVIAYQHSQFRHAPAYRKQDPGPFVDIHPEAAQERHICEGDTVTLSTRYGTLPVKAHVTNSVRRDCLRLLHGWQDANVNRLTSLKHLDPISGFPWCRALPATITICDS